MDRDWRRSFGYTPNWKNPRDLNEKIQWLITYGDTSRWTELADKVRVKDYVIKCGYPDIVVPTLGVWDRAEDVDFDTLPRKFVIKCNHDSGSTYLVDKDKGFDEGRLREDLKCHLQDKFGYRFGEMYYNSIKPRILAEKFLEGYDSDVSSSIIDYKIWCFGGVPTGILTCFDRKKESLRMNQYDVGWNVHPEWSVFSDTFRDGQGLLQRPKNLEYMLEIAAKLSSGFPEVRVDLYDLGGKVYFGEMTFSSLCGKMTYYSKEYLKQLGEQVILPRRK